MLLAFISQIELNSHGGNSLTEAAVFGADRAKEHLIINDALELINSHGLCLLVFLF